MDAPEVRVTGTLLSRKPRDESLAVSLLMGMLIAFVTMFCWRNPRAAAVLSASRDQVLAHHEFWRLLTTTAVHANLVHLAANLPFVVFFGYLLYGYFGVLVYPTAMLPLTAVGILLSLLTYPPQVTLIGASGLVYLMLGYWLVLYALIERTLPLKKRLLRVVGIAVIVLIPTTVQPEVSYRTHFIACGLGIIAGTAYFVANKQKIRSKETVEMEPPSEPGDAWHSRL